MELCINLFHQNKTFLQKYKLDLEVDLLYKTFQDKNDTKVLMWIGKQVVLSLIEKEIFCID